MGLVLPRNKILRNFLVLALLTGLFVPLLTLWPRAVSAAAVFTDPAFQKVWGRTDQAVAQGGANRSWFWGPEAFAHTSETYLQAPGGQRKVLYFDKSRMEINDPNGDKNSAYYVTNGLLTKELVSGVMQTGDNSFVAGAPANIPVAGDPTSNTTPTYASMASVTTLSPGEHTASQQPAGNPVTAQLDRNGNITQGSNLPAVSYAYYVSDTGHNIPDVLWNWMNNPQNGFDPGAGIDWVYVLGFPISEPFWTNTQVGGQNKQVLIQLYERRALTYTPTNNDPFKVEMGNIGQHYFRWRYSNGPANLSLTGPLPGDYRLLAVGRESGGGLGQKLYSLGANGSSLGQVYNITSQKVSPNGAYIAFANAKSPTTPTDATLSIMATGGAGSPLDIPLPAEAKLFDYTWQDNSHLVANVFASNGSGGTASLLLYDTTSPGTPQTLYSATNATLFNPSVSPDGKLLLFGQQDSSGSALYVLRLDRPNPTAQAVSGSQGYCLLSGQDDFGGSTTCTTFGWSSLSGFSATAGSGSDAPGTFAYLHETDHKLYRVDVRATASSLNDQSNLLANNAADLLGWQTNGNFLLYLSREGSDYIYYTLDSTNPNTRFELRRIKNVDPQLPSGLERWLDSTHLVSGDDVSNAKIVNYDGSGAVGLTPNGAPDPAARTLAFSPTKMAYLSADWKLVLTDHDDYTAPQVVDLTTLSSNINGIPTNLFWVNVQ